ncbi:MAG: C45 family autoproteolytic acyltransferase/hydrolase [Pseudomonadota bacterium]
MDADQLRLLQLNGSLYEQGRQYGEEDRETIHLAQSYWTQDVANDGIDPESFALALSLQQEIRLSLERYAPNFMAFMRGVAAGAGLPLHRLLAQNMMDEDWWLRRSLKQSDLLPKHAEKCSTVAGPSTQGMLAAQNLDIQPWVEGSQVVLGLEGPDGVRAMVAAVGGVPSCGVNDRGVATLLNTVIQLRSQGAGLPVCGFQFEVLFQPSAMAVYSLVTSVAHCSGHAYTAVDPAWIYAAECSAGGVALASADERGIFLRTNHPLASTDLRDATNESERAVLRSISTTHQRYAQMRDRLASVEILDNDAVIAALSCRVVEGAPVSRQLGDVQNIDGSVNIGYTSISMLAELPRDGDVRLHVAPGPPAITAYREFRFS